MISAEVIKTILDGYDVHSNVDFVFGGWVVTSDGDVINVENYYPIYSCHINDDEWLAQLRTKTWFDAQCEVDFLKAFEKACNILKVKVELKPDFD